MCVLCESCRGGGVGVCPRPDRKSSQDDGDDTKKVVCEGAFCVGVQRLAAPALGGQLVRHAWNTNRQQPVGIAILRDVWDVSCLVVAARPPITATTCWLQL